MYGLLQCNITVSFIIMGKGFKKSEDNKSMLVKTLMSCKRYFHMDWIDHHCTLDS